MTKQHKHQLLRNLRLLSPISLLLATLVSGIFLQSFSPHGDLHEQIQKVTKQIAEDPNNPDLYFLRGQLYHRHEEYESSEMDYLYTLDLDSSRCVVNLSLAELYLTMGQADDGLLRVNKYLECDPENNSARLTKARLLHYAGLHEEAIPAYEQALNTTRHLKPEYYFEIAECILADDSNNYLPALAWVNIGIERLEHPIQLELAAMKLETSARLYEEALSRCNRLMGPMARKEKWYERRGDIYAEAGNIQAAIANYHLGLKALEMLPASRRNVPAMIELKEKLNIKIEELSN